MLGFLPHMALRCIFNGGRCNNEVCVMERKDSNEIF
jgi:hypothetical protein